MGLRVVRSDDWQWDNQDGGEGGVGTIVEVGGRDGSMNPDKTVVVVWDTGVRAKYRAGYMRKDDLRVLDTAPAGSIYSQQCCVFFLRFLNAQFVVDVLFYVFTLTFSDILTITITH